MRQPFLVSAALIALLSGGPTLAADPHAGHGAAPATATTAIPATGAVKSVEAAASKAVIAHDPIPALKWPAMTMDFRLADKALAGKIKAGDKVKFTLTPGDKGSYTITAIETMP
ncbi:MAG: copper-binding protein [Candidatus Contendobacter sp.]|nr:copper-binding protein [Candidatus Contendobacter sp.]